MIFIKKNILITLFSVFIILSLVNFISALPIGSCNPTNCPTGYYQSGISCSDNICYVTCNSFSGCSSNYTTSYTDSEFLPDLNIPSYSGASFKELQIGNFTPNNMNKCYRFRQTTPNNFISSSDIANYDSLNNFDSGIALVWTNPNAYRWYNHQKYFSFGGSDNVFLRSYIGGVWTDSCTDTGDNFDSADSFSNTNSLYCAPTPEACNNFNNSYCNTGCYNTSTKLVLVLSTELGNGKSCNSFNDFENSEGGWLDDAEIDYVNFASQTVYMYVDEYDAILNDSFNNTCNYWSECNPADSCCDVNGHLRSSGYVCKSAHNAVCDNSGSCSGHAYEDKCDGTSSICPDNNYEINYSKICDDITCVAQSCSGFTLQPERTCSAGVCQTNNPFDCSNNLNCLNGLSCKREASSSSDCKTGYTYDSQYKVCALNNNNETAYGMVYDANGNLISGFGLNSSYNNLNQLVNVTDSVAGTLIAKYFYGPDGNRVKSIVYNGGQNTTTYYFDNFVQIINSSGVYNESYYYYYDKLIGKKDISGNIYFYHPDALGSTSLITDSNGNTVANLSYEPYGGLIQTSNERYTFTGQEIDPELSLLYMKTRYYNPNTGQFTQPDTLVQDIYNPQNLNKYAYVVNNPYKYTDPNGEFPLPLITGAIGAAFGGIAGGIYAATNGQNVWAGIGIGAVSGFVAGATLGLGTLAMGTSAGIAVTGAVGYIQTAGTIGAISGIAGQATSNALNGAPLSSGMEMAGAMGYVTGPMAVAGAASMVSGGSSNNGINFANRESLTEHFQSHGEQLGFTSEQQYLKGAQKLASATGGNIEQYARTTGEIVKINKATGEFMVQTGDGIIKTYFNPSTDLTKSYTYFLRDKSKYFGG